jgi:hypothetical protein
LLFSHNERAKVFEDNRFIERPGTSVNCSYGTLLIDNLFSLLSGKNMKPVTNGA